MRRKKTFTSDSAGVANGWSGSQLGAAGARLDTVRVGLGRVMRVVALLGGGPVPRPDAAVRAGLVALAGPDDVLLGQELDDVELVAEQDRPGGEHGQGQGEAGHEEHGAGVVGDQPAEHQEDQALRRDGVRHERQRLGLVEHGRHRAHLDGQQHADGDQQALVDDAGRVQVPGGGRHARARVVLAAGADDDLRAQRVDQQPDQVDEHVDGEHAGQDDRQLPVGDAGHRLALDVDEDVQDAPGLDDDRPDQQDEGDGQEEGARGAEPRQERQVHLEQGGQEQEQEAAQDADQHDGLEEDGPGLDDGLLAPPVHEEGRPEADDGAQQRHGHADADRGQAGVGEQRRQRRARAERDGQVLRARRHHRPPVQAGHDLVADGVDQLVPGRGADRRQRRRPVRDRQVAVGHEDLGRPVQRRRPDQLDRVDAVLALALQRVHRQAQRPRREVRRADGRLPRAHGGQAGGQDGARPDRRPGAVRALRLDLLDGAAARALVDVDAGRVHGVGERHDDRGDDGPVRRPGVRRRAADADVGSADDGAGRVPVRRRRRADDVVDPLRRDADRRVLVLADVVVGDADAVVADLVQRPVLGHGADQDAGVARPHPVDEQRPELDVGDGAADERGAVADRVGRATQRRGQGQARVLQRQRLVAGGAGGRPRARRVRAAGRARVAPDRTGPRLERVHRARQARRGERRQRRVRPCRAGHAAARRLVQVRALGAHDVDADAERRRRRPRVADHVGDRRERHAAVAVVRQDLEAGAGQRHGRRRDRVPRRPVRVPVLDDAVVGHARHRVGDRVAVRVGPVQDDADRLPGRARRVKHEPADRRRRHDLVGARRRVLVAQEAVCAAVAGVRQVGGRVGRLGRRDAGRGVQRGHRYRGVQREVGLAVEPGLARDAPAGDQVVAAPGAVADDAARVVVERPVGEQVGFVAAQLLPHALADLGARQRPVPQAQVVVHALVEDLAPERPGADRDVVVPARGGRALEPVVRPRHVGQLAPVHVDGGLRPLDVVGHERVMRPPAVERRCRRRQVVAANVPVDVVVPVRHLDVPAAPAAPGAELGRPRLVHLAVAVQAEEGRVAGARRVQVGPELDRDRRQAVGRRDARPGQRRRDKVLLDAVERRGVPRRPCHRPRVQARVQDDRGVLRQDEAAGRPHRQVDVDRGDRGARLAQHLRERQRQGGRHRLDDGAGRRHRHAVDRDRADAGRQVHPGDRQRGVAPDDAGGAVPGDQQRDRDRVGTRRRRVLARLDDQRRRRRVGRERGRRRDARRRTNEQAATDGDAGRPGRHAMVDGRALRLVERQVQDQVVGDVVGAGRRPHHGGDVGRVGDGALVDADVVQVALQRLVVGAARRRVELADVQRRAERQRRVRRRVVASSLQDAVDEVVLEVGRAHERQMVPGAVGQVPPSDVVERALAGEVEALDTLDLEEANPVQLQQGAVVQSEPGYGHLGGRQSRDINPGGQRHALRRERVRAVAGRAQHRDLQERATRWVGAEPHRAPARRYVRLGQGRRRLTGKHEDRHGRNCCRQRRHLGVRRLNLTSGASWVGPERFPGRYCDRL